MNELTFRLAYGVFAATFVCVALFLLARGLDQRRYLRPVLYGFFLGIGGWALFGAGIFAFLLGGVLTGYLLAREVGGWKKHLQAGGLVGMLFIPNFSVIPAAYTIFTSSLRELVDEIATEVGYQVGQGELLAVICGNTLLWAFMVMVIVGVGAILGGYIRKTLKPAE